MQASLKLLMLSMPVVGEGLEGAEGIGVKPRQRCEGGNSVDKSMVPPDREWVVCV